VNVDGVLRGVHAVLPHMLAQQAGDILITSSISGHVDIVWEPVYSASKSTRCRGSSTRCAARLAPAGIRVGSIAPGMVANELWGVPRPCGHRRDGGASRGSASARRMWREAVVFMLAQPRHVTIRDLVMLPQNQDI
jgi:ribitol 2-dehydrogenase